MNRVCIPDVDCDRVASLDELVEPDQGRGFLTSYLKTESSRCREERWAPKDYLTGSQSTAVGPAARSRRLAQLALGILGAAITSTFDRDQCAPADALWTSAASKTLSRRATPTSRERKSSVLA